MVRAAVAEGAIAQLSGRRAVVAANGLGIARKLAQGLKRHGAKVVEIRAALTSKARAEQELADAARALGGIDLVVHASAGPLALQAKPIEGLSPDDWNSAVHKSMLATLFCLQGAHAQQHATGGAVVIVGPSTALVGAANAVPLMTLAEAQRALVKSAARQWGGLGMRLNWVGVPPAEYDEALAELAAPQTPELGPPPPALRRRPLAQDDIADAIAWLGSEGARGVTGGTFNLDGGDWMVP